MQDEMKDSSPALQPNTAQQFFIILSLLFGLIFIFLVYNLLTAEFYSYTRVILTLAFFGVGTYVAGKKGFGRGAAAAATLFTDEIARYLVVYKGGLAAFPVAQSGQISMHILSDRFAFEPTFSTKAWFFPMAIHYTAIRSIAIVERVITGMEATLSGSRSDQFRQNNNIHITFQEEGGSEIMLRLEMSSGFHVMGQAEKCLEFMDRLRVLGVMAKFTQPPLHVSGVTICAEAPAAAGDPTSHATDGKNAVELLASLATLHDRGVLTDAEFVQKKAEILQRI